MNPVRIAELLEPFLRVPGSVGGESTLLGPDGSKGPDPCHCHSEPAKTGEEPAALSPVQLQRISTYIDILVRWNVRINLTAIRDPEDIVTRHFGESLFAARHLFPLDAHAGTTAQGRPERSPRGCPDERTPAALRLADIGSGAGFPGLAIKLWAPHIALALIESNHKKAAFLGEVTRSLTLTDVDVQNTRAETISANRFDIVTLRAVEHFESILPIAAALVASPGRLALLIGASQQDQARASLRQFTWSPPVRVPSSRARILLIGHRQPDSAETERSTSLVHTPQGSSMLISGRRTRFYRS
jgi:16S rRNA (guanine527-N7)-methyltransferase